MTQNVENGLPSVSIMLSSSVPPERTLSAARRAEEAGFRRMWITEDYFRKGAFSAAGAILGASAHLNVGLGVASAYVRQLPLLAMEAATLHALFPGRFELGVGSGSVPVLEALHRRPTKLIGSLRNRVDTLSALLAGNNISWEDEFDRFENVSLEYPREGGALWIAAESPQMLKLAAKRGDGLLLSAWSSAGYVRWVNEHIATTVAARQQPLQVATFVYVSVGADDDIAFRRARDHLAARLAAGRVGATWRYSSYWHRIEPLLGGSHDELLSQLDQEFVAAFVPFGSEASSQILEIVSAGATEIALAPIPVDGELDVEGVLPALANLADSVGAQVRRG